MYPDNTKEDMDMKRLNRPWSVDGLKTFIASVTVVVFAPDLVEVERKRRDGAWQWMLHEWAVALFQSAGLAEDELPDGGPLVFTDPKFGKGVAKILFAIGEYGAGWLPKICGEGSGSTALFIELEADLEGAPRTCYTLSLYGGEQSSTVPIATREGVLPNGSTCSATLPLLTPDFDALFGAWCERYQQQPAQVSSPAAPEAQVAPLAGLDLGALVASLTDPEEVTVAPPEDLQS